MSKDILTVASLVSVFVGVKGLLEETFSRDDGIISRENALLLSNEEDRNNINQAIKKLKEDDSIKEETVPLSNGEEIVIST